MRRAVLLRLQYNPTLIDGTVLHGVKRIEHKIENHLLQLYPVAAHQRQAEI